MIALATTRVRGVVTADMIADDQIRAAGRDQAT
jgi:hypothetical protein